MKATVETLRDELLDQQEELLRTLKHSYRSVRKQVREQPEKSLLIALASGFVLGYLVKKAVSDN